MPVEGRGRAANRFAQAWATEHAKRRGVDRRAFMLSACGADSTLLAFNAANAAEGRTGGFYELDQVAALDAQVAALDADAAAESLNGFRRHETATDFGYSGRPSAHH